MLVTCSTNRTQVPVCHNLDSIILPDVILSKYGWKFCISHMQISINAVAIVSLI